uniref:Ribosomal RNA large subunit methyltransferase K/L-like methyltransferase domain-containing protein n=1 Tax=Scylla olivacea TaxID=85551 RepID=A0A0P4WQF5_SCYOL
MADCMVTYGRGLDDFVWKEIVKKIPNAYNLRHLGEGKIAFSTVKSGARQSQGNVGEECDAVKDLHQEIDLIDSRVKHDLIGNKIAQEHTCDAFEKGDSIEIKELNANSEGIMGPLAINTQENNHWVSAVSHIFKLKLVERVFTLLHCEDINARPSHQNHGRKFSVSDILRDYESKLRNLVVNLEWDKLAVKVRRLREHQDGEQQVWCQDPDSCPGSLRRKQEKKKLGEKRKAPMSLTELQGNIPKHHKAGSITREHFQNKKNRKQGSKRRKLTDRCESKSSSDSYSLCDYENGKISETNVGTYNIRVKSESELENLHNNKMQNLQCLHIDDKSEMTTSSSQVTGSGKDSLEAVMSHAQSTSQLNKLYSSQAKNGVCEDKVMVLSEIKNGTNKVDLVSENYISSQNDQLMTSDCPPFPQEHKPEEVKAENQDFKVNFKEQVSTFRVSSRVSGHLKNILTVKWINHTLSEQLKKANTSWVPDWRQPLVDLYVNITASHFIIGAALSPRPLSLRPYIPHLTLRSTISHLMATLSQIPPEAIVLDPMCGGGSILLETAMNFDLSHVIASDSSREQLEVARCNLHNIPVPVTFLEADAEKLPLQDCSINTVLCDFPFGHKYKLTMEGKQLLAGLLMEVQRLLVCGGQAVFLLSPSQHQVLSQLTSDNTKASTPRNPSVGDNLTLLESHLVSLGETSAYVAVLVKGSTTLEVFKERRKDCKSCHNMYW